MQMLSLSLSFGCCCRLEIEEKWGVCRRTHAHKKSLLCPSISSLSSPCNFYFLFTSQCKDLAAVCVLTLSPGVDWFRGSCIQKSPPLAARCTSADQDRADDVVGRVRNPSRGPRFQWGTPAEMTLSDFTREMSSSSSPFSNSLRLVASLHLPVDSSINEPFLGGRNRESRRGRRRNGWRREARHSSPRTALVAFRCCQSQPTGGFASAISSLFAPNFSARPNLKSSIHLWLWKQQNLSLWIRLWERKSTSSSSEDLLAVFPFRFLSLQSVSPFYKNDWWWEIKPRPLACPPISNCCRWEPGDSAQTSLTSRESAQRLMMGIHMRRAAVVVVVAFFFLMWGEVSCRVCVSDIAYSLCTDASAHSMYINIAHLFKIDV